MDALLNHLLLTKRSGRTLRNRVTGENKKNANIESKKNPIKITPIPWIKVRSMNLDE